MFVIWGQANEGVWRSIGVHGVASTPASAPRSQSDRWFHVKPRSYSSDAPFPLGPQNHDGQRCGHRAAGLIDPAGSCWPGTAFPPGGRPHLPVPAPKLQHRRARPGVKAGSAPRPRSTHSASGGRHWSGLVRTSRWFQATFQPAARLSRHPTFWRVMYPQPFRLNSSSVRRCPRTSAMTDNSVSTCFT